MERTLIELIEKGGWWKRSPATVSEIEGLSEKFNCKLPEDYKSILLFSNGGSLNKFKTPFIIYSITEVLALYHEFDLYETIPKSLIFGGDGGGTIYLYDLRDENMPVLFLREDYVSYENIIYKSSSLTEVLKMVMNNEKLN